MAERLTLRQAADWLAGRGHPLSVRHLQRAVQTGALAAEVIDAPRPYAVVRTDDLLTWVNGRRRVGRPKHRSEHE